MINTESRELVPLNHANSEHILFDLNLPPMVPTEYIGVDLENLERLRRLGGIRNLTMYASADGETSSFVPAVVGFDGASATAGLKGAAVAAEPSSENGNPIGNPYEIVHWTRQTDANIILNTREVTQQILREPKWKRGIQDPAAWAFYINSALKRGISNIGAANLVNLTEIDWLGALVVTSTSPLAVLTFNDIKGAFVGLGLAAAFNTFSLMTLPLIGREGRFSLVTLLTGGPQVDRALWLKFQASRTTLVKNINKKPEFI